MGGGDGACGRRRQVRPGRCGCLGRRRFPQAAHTEIDDGGGTNAVLRRLQPLPSSVPRSRKPSPHGHAHGKATPMRVSTLISSSRRGSAALKPKTGPGGGGPNSRPRASPRPLLLIGHGLGATAVVHAAEALAGADVRGAFLVTPPDDAALGRLAGPAWAQPQAPLPWPSVVVASRNDPDGAFKAVAAIAHAWDAELIDAGLAGRLDAASGHGPWPEGLMRLAGFIKRISDRPRPN